MRDIVRQSFHAFSESLEGEVEIMYADHLGKVTVGIGCLVDSPEAARAIRDQVSWAALGYVV